MSKAVDFTCIMTLITIAGLFITTLTENHGTGPINFEPVTLSSGYVGWMLLYSMIIWLGALFSACTN